MRDTPAHDLPLLLERQRAFFSQGETQALAGRLESLKNLQISLESSQEEILEALATDLGKPPIEAFLAEYHFILEELRLVQSSLQKWLRPQRVGSPFYFWPCLNQIRREPYGAVLIMAPWNYPLQLALSPLIAAVAAGNTVILKPSELAPASATLLTKIVESSFSPEQVAVVTGGPEVSAQLLELQFGFIFFTGSTEVGKIVARQAAQNLTPVILELGGKCPCIVDRNADLTLTARRILVGKLFNAGQTCFAPDFIAVHEEVRESLVQELQALLEDLPWETEMAKIVHKRHFDRLQQLVSGEVIQKGADDPATLHFAPRLLPEADWEDPCMREEIFGPLLPIVSFTKLDDLVAKLRQLSAPLALYCFSRDQEFCESLMAQVPSGGVCLNDVAKQASNLALPFGGTGGSGHGRYRGKTGVLALSQERAVTRRYFIHDVFEALPPRAEKAKFLRKWLK